MQNKVEKADVEFKGHTESVVNLAWHPKRDDQLASLSDKTIRWAMQHQENLQQGVQDMTEDMHGRRVVPLQA